MRKCNAVLSIALIVLFLIHGIIGGFEAAGIYSGGGTLMSLISYFLLFLCLVHAVIGVILTIQTLKALHRAGKSYFKENIVFWTRRISGFAIILFVILHTCLFIGRGSGSEYRLALFNGLQLAIQILMVISIAVHVLSNIKPLMISLGAGNFRAYLKDVLWILAIVCFFCAAAFLIYFLRWNVLWR